MTRLRGGRDVDVQITLLALIATLARQRGPASVAQLAEDMGATKITTQRYLSALAEALPGVIVEPDPEHSQRSLWSLDRRAARRHLGL